MARITWGTAGERYYEAGADRGVLYVDSVGVPWNGLTAVKEAPTGGDAKPYYLDGIRYLNISSAEEFAASIEAFSSPREFDRCDGTASISNGLFITQQPRKSFGLSYRTKVGNDIEGLEYGYKLHLVYNALAAPSSRDNSSLNESVSPNTLSWNISTTPPRVPAYKPSAHMVIDSRQAPAILLEMLESALYGTPTTQPRLPSQAELVGLFSNYDELELLVLQDDGTQTTQAYPYVVSDTAPAVNTGRQVVWQDTSSSGPDSLKLVIGD